MHIELNSKYANVILFSKIDIIFIKIVIVNIRIDIQPLIIL